MRSIFRKQLIIYFAIIIMSLSILGVALWGLFRNYFIEQKLAILDEQCYEFAGIYEEYNRRIAEYTYIGPLEHLEISELGRQLQQAAASMADTLNKYLDASIFIIDTDSNIIVASPDISELRGETFFNPAFNGIYGGERVSTQGKLGGLLRSNSLTVAYPMFLNGEFNAAVFANAPISDIEKSLSDVAGITLMCLGATAVMAFIFIYIFSRQITSPIKRISAAAGVIAGGDFEKRLTVKSRDEVGLLAQSFNNMAESLNNQETQRRQFIANISHDLRSPLTSMRGFLQAMIDGTIPEGSREKYIGIVLEETIRLSKLANDILDINKIQTLDIEISPTDFDINELIRKTAEMFEGDVREKEIQFSLEFAAENTTVHADYEKIRRVLCNLLDNAVKFTPNGGAVTIETQEAENGRLAVSVSDSGRGISAKEQKRVFERFYKADTSRGEDTHGSGLGLAIVREFIRAHGESITLASEAGLGARFTFTLKLSEHNA